MISILICDDDRIFALRLKASVEALLEEKRTAGKVSVFNSAEEIGGETLANCDAAFLDIDFVGKEYNGLDIARRIRSLRNDAVIVFVTNFVEYAPAGYEVRAFRYLLKDELTKKLDECIDRVLQQLRAEKSDIKIQVEGEQISLPVRNLVYMESMGHTLIFHALCKGYEPDRTYTCYGTIRKMEEALSERGFLRCQKSYLVNMAHIKKLNSTQVLLSNGVPLPVSSRGYAECKRRYLLWKGRDGWTF